MRFKLQPRAAYCTGCGVVFDKMHLMINHRRTFRCGGRFLPTDERQLWNAQFEYYQDFEHNSERHAKGRVGRDHTNYLYKQWRRCLVEAITLRKLRLDRERDTQTATG
jgi:hypothetical protein